MAAISVPEADLLLSLAPHIQAPGNVEKGETFQVRTLIQHQMETGLRHDSSGAVIPRKIVHRFTCSYNGRVVFNVDLREAMAANPYLAFFVRADESGSLRFEWEADGGATASLTKPITVRDA